MKWTSAVQWMHKADREYIKDEARERGYVLTGKNIERILDDIVGGKEAHRIMREIENSKGR